MLYNIPTGAKYFYSKMIMHAYNVCLNINNFINSIYQESITLFQKLHYITLL